MTAHSKRGPRLSRSLGLVLLYAGGCIAMTSAAFLAARETPSSVESTLYGAFIVTGFLLAVPGLGIVLWRAFQKPPPVDAEPGWDTIYAVQQRLAAYARDAAAHALAIPFVVIACGALAYAVVTRLLGEQDAGLKVALGLAFVMVALGGILPFHAFMREAKRLRELSVPRPADEDSSA